MINDEDDKVSETKKGVEEGAKILKRGETEPAIGQAAALCGDRGVAKLPAEVADHFNLSAMAEAAERVENFHGVSEMVSASVADHFNLSPMAHAAEQPNLYGIGGIGEISADVAEFFKPNSMEQVVEHATSSHGMSLTEKAYQDVTGLLTSSAIKRAVEQASNLHGMIGAEKVSGAVAEFFMPSSMERAFEQSANLVGMSELERAARETSNGFHTPVSDDFLRLTGYSNAWQRELDAIKVLTASEHFTLSGGLPNGVEDELKRFREAIAPPPVVLKMMRDVEEEAKRSQRMLQDLTESVLSPSVLSGYGSLHNLLDGMAQQAAAIGSIDLTAEFVASFLAPADQYGRFLRDTVTQLSAYGIDPEMSRALQGSIVLADDILGTNIGITAEMTTGIVQSSAAPATAAGGLTLPFAQRDELVAARGRFSSLDLGELRLHSPSNGVARRANVVVQSLVDVNTARKLKMKVEIFKHTNRSVLAVRDIVLLVARDPRSLADFLDTVYILLYEAAGDDHLRYLDSEGGELARGECDVVWIIKHLRNYARHDLDHGKPTDVRNKWRAIDEDLRKLGMERMPTTELEFRRLQARILEMAEGFLKTILDRIT